MMEQLELVSLGELVREDHHYRKFTESFDYRVIEREVIVFWIFIYVIICKVNKILV